MKMLILGIYSGFAEMHIREDTPAGYSEVGECDSRWYGR